MMKNNTYIEKIFNQDVRDKKIIGRSASKRASRTGKIGLGGVKTASDYMTTKEKRSLNGDVVMSNKYYKIENLTRWIDFKVGKSDAVLSDILYNLKKNYTSMEIAEALSISNGTLYNLYTKYGIKYKKRPVKNRPPHHAMSKKEQRASLLERRVKLLPTYLEFQQMESDLRTKVLIYIKTKIGIGRVADAWGISFAKLNEFCKKSGASKYRLHASLDFDILDIIPRNVKLIGDNDKKEDSTDNKESVGIKEKITVNTTDDENEELKVDNLYISKEEHDGIVNSLKEDIERLKLEVANSIKVYTPNISVSDKLEEKNSLNYNINGSFSADEAKVRLEPLIHLLLDSYNYDIDLKIKGYKK